MTEGDKVKFRVDRDALAEAVTWTARTLPQRPATAVLAGVRMSAADGVVTLSSFDYEVSATARIEADIAAPGEVLVSGRLLSDICKSLPNKPVDVDLEGAALAITCGAANFSLMSMPLDAYPQLPQMPEQTGTIDAQALAHAVGQVARASAKDDTLPLLTTIHMGFDGDVVTLMATDRYRLAVRTLEWSPASQVEVSALIKAKTLSDMTKSLTGAGEISLSLATEPGSAKLVGMEVAGRHMTSLLTDGDYPPVAKLFPDTSNIRAVCDREELIAALRRVALVTQRSAPVRLTFNAGGLQLEAGQGEDAQASEHLTCHLQGDDIETAFNPGYLLDGLQALDTTYVRLSFTHATKPVVLTGQEEIGGEDSQDMRYLLMPIRYA